MRRVILAALALAIALAVVQPALAAPSARGQRVHMFHSKRVHGAKRVALLTYHNGPVLRTNRTYAIYWLPSGQTMASGYQTTINQYLGDVAAASGLSSNVYFTETQYSDTTGSIAYNSQFLGSTVDTSALPANGCSVYTGVTACLTDAQIQSEVKRVVAAKGLPKGNVVYFLLTPKGVGSCLGTSCAFKYYCAYHSNIGTGSSAILYANQPYAATDPAACGSGQHPNGNVADDTINVLSHEHRESINDPFGSAWYDRQGYEGSDKCAWSFGAALGTASNGSLYNQLINGHKYYTQQEWSNARTGCVLTGL